ncbi:hydantoinase/oxoprolinase family protein [Sinosporangium siamense]|uniref:Hydantoinase A/oxoprolinase domain-containing protein n=1 Tax=Sinosporangium siamense TaxID=1367973 RepID=A0A919RIL9_9ACTN|nr:hydantoinase/oxoprolinase family protein [Sinosporangium siamense]GII92544.1 hypothetical protein Ssi02_27750 [Sinosporangium siamense]
MNTGGPFRLGISIAGPRFGAVAVDDSGRVVASEVTEGFGGLAVVVGSVLKQVGAGRIGAAMLAMSAFADWLRDHRTVGRVGVLRVGATPTTAVPPLAGWPREVAERVAGPWLTTAGGIDIDGSTAGELDLDAVRDFAGRCGTAASAVAVSGSFSYLDNRPERAAAAVVRDVLGAGYPITLSDDVGGFGLYERENAAILNAALGARAQTLIEGVRSILHEHGVGTELFVARNDGTLVTAPGAAALPIHIVSGHLAAVVRGHARMAGVENAIVVGGGGRHPGAGVVRHGRLVLEPTPTLAGVRTNQPVPLGFMAPAGMTEDHLVSWLRRRVGDLPVLDSEAGGPAIAAAVGVALAPVSGNVWSFVGDGGDRVEGIAEAGRQAVDRAVLAGADPAGTEVRQVVETQATYMSGGALRLFVQAAGRPFSSESRVP